ncbi:MAG: galactose oxidase [Planctomycetota bacterium]|nr:galactose oxidase [Planctomycetota bacterium]
MMARSTHTRVGFFLLTTFATSLCLSLIARDGDAAEPLNWVKVTGEAGWRPRDSQGEAVFRDRLWVLGGWFDSFQAPPRDVWSSADGKTWKQSPGEAPWKHSDLPMTLVFGDRMWLMGGWYNGRLPGHSASAEVWSTRDGEQWEQVTDKAGWTPRIAAGAVVFQGKMWILGGTENYYFVTDSAGWSPRAYHQAVVLNDRMYVMGGGNYVPKYHAVNDVWSSADGKTWVKETTEAPWSPRLWFSSVTYRDRMWVLGGWSNNPSKNWGDVWYSRDGKSWYELKTETRWKERHEHSAYVFQDRLWIAGGHAQPLSSEVWSIDIPAEALK